MHTNLKYTLFYKNYESFSQINFCGGVYDAEWKMKQPTSRQQVYWMCDIITICYKLPSTVLCRNLLVRQWMICSSYGDYLVWWNPIRCFGTIRGLEQSEHHADIPVQHLSHFVLMFPYYCSANCNIPHCICFRHRTAMLPLPLVWLVSWLGVTLAIATLAVIYIMICRYWSPIMYDQSIVNVIRSLVEYSQAYWSVHHWSLKRVGSQ